MANRLEAIVKRHSETLCRTSLKDAMENWVNELSAGTLVIQAKIGKETKIVSFRRAAKE